VPDGWPDRVPDGGQTSGQTGWPDGVPDRWPDGVARWGARPGPDGGPDRPDRVADGRIIYF
jgi:hypothetical protein